LAALKTVVSWFSYLFHFVLALILLGLAGIALISGPRSLHLEMLPWSGATLEYILLGGALFGLLSIVFAITGRLRFLFLLWSLAVAVLLTKGYIFSGYRFGAGELRHAAYLIGAAWVAVAGAWFQLRAKPDRGPRQYRMK
jgi:hypothetical protein